MLNVKLIVFIFCIYSFSCITAWWWPEFRVETGCHVVKLFVKFVLFVTENTDRYCDCYLNGTVLLKNSATPSGQLKEWLV